MAKKPTKLQQEYKKELRRLRQRIAYAKKAGYYLTEQIEIPTIEKPTRKDISKIKSLRGKKLYSKLGYVDLKSGELIGGNKPRGYSEQYKKWVQENEFIANTPITQPVEETPTISIDAYRQIVDNFINELEYWYDRYRSTTAKSNTLFIRDSINSMVSNVGYEAVAEGLMRAERDGFSFDPQDPYDDNKVKLFLNEIFSRMPDRNISETIVNNINYLIDSQYSEPI